MITDPVPPALAENTRPEPHRHDTEAWIFDLDNTLYPAHCNLFDQVDRRIGEFVSAALDLDPAEARLLQKKYFRDHGTTLNGLMQIHAIKPADYLAYVHDIDVSGLPDGTQLDLALSGLEGRKLIYTNGSTGHAENIMRQLGVSHHFEAIFDIVASDYRPKPDPAPYADMVRLHGIDPSRTVMIEDIARNLKPAAALGMATVWLRTHHDWSHDDSDGDHVHHATDDLVDWLEALPSRDAH
jgi:putative hydrolase of the HAD superfamily